MHAHTTGIWKAWVATRNDTCLYITLNIYINVIYRPVSFLVVTQAFQVPVHIPSLTPILAYIQRGSYLTRSQNESSSVEHGQFPWFFTKLSSCLFDNLFILIPYHCIITKERIKINVTRSLFSNSILSKDAVA